ncbi:MAG: hypothetical protein HYX61_07545 [Gammaproteobacteria bacterium]|nr:hypothetical protein [Gammaproteobacteria bacterium]
MNKPLTKIELCPEMDDLHTINLPEKNISQIHPQIDLHQATDHHLIKREDQDDQDMKSVAILSCN